ncbi:MAG: hydantoinase/oxoprolinase family protein [Steroidobacteraceae bacterium]
MASEVPASVYCIGVDVGGTFTDVVLSDGSTVWRAKAPSRHGAIGEGVLEGCKLVAAEAGTTLAQLLPQVERFGLGTTAVTNVIATRSGLRVGLVTTAGFEDLVPMARVRRIPQAGWLVPPDTLVERECIRGVGERVDRHGQVLLPLDTAEVLSAARSLVEDCSVEAIVVSFLWSCANPAHEKAAMAALAAEFPQLVLVSGAELLPVMREYERSTFAILNAYTARALDGLDELMAGLRRMGLRHAPLLVHSGGGSVSVTEGRRTPAILAESGPAAGVVGALAICESAGIRNAVTCDMGGTSFDMSLIRDLSPARRARGDLMGIWTALPRVDIESASAGGGSIGWRDSLGLLRVGPRSAGAVPGPACYGRGGEAPTVTDAMLVLGYLDPAQFLGGKMQLDADAAQRACARLGEEIGATAERVAWGIRELALTEMSRALRGEFSRGGDDPREFWLVSLGGCGGLFNAEIAGALGLAGTLIPELSSVLSAFGSASADVRRERTSSLSQPMPMQADLLAAAIDTLAAMVKADLAADGIPVENRSLEVELDLRFARQQWELPMRTAGTLDAGEQLAIVEAFKREYARRYGQGALVSGAPVEIASLRVVGSGKTVRPTLVAAADAPAREAVPAGQRAVLTEEAGQLVSRRVPAYRVGQLGPGCRLRGPAIVDAPDTTLWIPAGRHARVDRFLTLHVESTNEH